MFPDYILEENEEHNGVNYFEGCDFLFDYEKGQHYFRGGELQTCNQLGTIKQYIENILRTALAAYEVYTLEETEPFGISVYNHLGERSLPMGYVNSELKREVTEQALRNPNIVGIENWKAERERRGLHIWFNAVLADGTLLELEDVVGSYIQPAPVIVEPESEPEPTPPPQPEPEPHDCGYIKGIPRLFGGIVETIVGEAIILEEVQEGA